MPVLEFDATKHEYTHAGRVVPGVTSILGGAGLYDYSHIPSAALEIARQKGVAIHRTVELDCAGDLDEEGLPDWLVPVLVRWREWRDAVGFSLLASECQVYHPVYGYAGTLDLVGMLRAKQDRLAIVDVKRSFGQGSVIGLQLAAYGQAYCVQRHLAPEFGRYALRLHESQPLKMEAYTSRHDFSIFLAALTLAKFKRSIQHA
jgi:hypothetical protein